MIAQGWNDLIRTASSAKRGYRLSSEIAEWRQLNSAPLPSTSDELGWKSMHVAGRHWSPFEYGVIPAVNDTMIGLALDSKMIVDRRIGGSRWMQRNYQKHAVHLIPPNVQAEMRLHTSSDSLQVYLDNAVLKDTAGGMIKGDPSKVELKPLMAELDPALAQLLLVVQSALNLPASVSVPHADAVAAALAVHLIQHHSTATIDATSFSRCTLGRPQLEAVLCYIHSCLNKEITLAELASIANLSVAQLIRQFRQKTGTPPHQYIMRARVERAKKLLEKGQSSIAEISADCGFDSQSSLTRVFKRFLGTTPNAYRVACGRCSFAESFLIRD